MLGCNLIMSEFVDVAPAKYGKCQILRTTPGEVMNMKKEKWEPLK